MADNLKSDNEDSDVLTSDHEENAAPEKGLGRGLAALFGEDDEQDIYDFLSEADDENNDFESSDDMSFRMMPVGWIKPCRNQPRQNFDTEALKELADSIAVHGIIQPLLVRPLPDEDRAYEIIAGERRWRAAQIAQLHEVPVTIQYLTDSDVMELALIENLQREDLTAIEEAEGYHYLMDVYGHTQEKMAASLGKSRSHIANMLRLLNLPDSVKQQVNKGALSAGHARSLVGSNDPEAMAQKILEQNLSVRDAERLKAEENAAKNGASKTSGSSARGGASSNASSTEKKSVDILALEKELSNLLGLVVRIETKGKGGELMIQYQNLEQMDDILHRLSHNPGRITVNG